MVDCCKCSRVWASNVGDAFASNLDFSSHTMVALGAVWILCRLYSRAISVWLTLGIGCAVTRVASHLHFTSDVVTAVAFCHGITFVIWHLLKRQHQATIVMSESISKNSFFSTKTS